MLERVKGKYHPFMGFAYIFLIHASLSFLTIYIFWFVRISSEDLETVVLLYMCNDIQRTVVAVVKVVMCVIIK